MSKLINIKRVRVWKLVEALRLEQKSAEGRVLVTQAFLQPNRKAKQANKDHNLRQVCATYKLSKPLRYLNSVASHLGSETVAITGSDDQHKDQSEKAIDCCCCFMGRC